jgi:hypothetical protein
VEERNLLLLNVYKYFCRSIKSKMNYLKLYCRLVRKFEERGLTKKEAKEQGLYVEGHHIFPRSIYGEDNEGNNRIVYVSAKEHYILHAVLEKLCIQRYGLNHPHTRKMNKAHISMSTNSKTNEMIYVNSRLYESARIRQSQLSVGKNHPCTLHIKVYFDDGRVVDCPDGASGFCREYPQYKRNCVSLMAKGAYKSNYKDIIKVEILNPERIYTQKTKEEREWNKKHLKNTNAIPVRIWFGDGRIYDCWEGIKNFCDKNPKYNNRQLYNLFRKKGQQTYYKDIVKVELLDKNSTPNPEPIYFKITRSRVKPVRFTFKDGSTLDWYDGLKEFCEQNPQYRRGNLDQVKSGIRNSCGDIIKVENIILEDIKDGPKILELPTENLAKCDPFRVYYNDGRIEEWYGSKTDFCKKYPQYYYEALNRIISGERKTHKDILKIEIIDPNDTTEPTPMYSLSRRKNAQPIRIYFDNGTYEDCYEGAREFCKKYPEKEYDHRGIFSVKTKRRKTHKDIIKVEVLNYTINTPLTPNNQ